MDSLHLCVRQIESSCIRRPLDEGNRIFFSRTFTWIFEWRELCYEVLGQVEFESESISTGEENAIGDETDDLGKYIGSKVSSFKIYVKNKDRSMDRRR